MNIGIWARLRESDRRLMERQREVARRERLISSTEKRLLLVVLVVAAVSVSILVGGPHVAPAAIVLGMGLMFLVTGRRR